jgi:hypothetical protein
VAKSSTREKLRSISDIRRFFHRNETPIYFVSPTNFNLHGMDEWVRNFKFVGYIDCYDGRHPNAARDRTRAVRMPAGRQQLSAASWFSGGGVQGLRPTS